MAVDFANVNISLAEFQGISSGKYNAGEVMLASETKLDKVNNHVHLTGSNAKPLSHEAVFAVKNAFVKALSSNGVGANEIARVRRDLGLASEAGMDKTLHERSLKPLTRQQVRQILDRYAGAINAHADQVPGAERVRTSAEIYGEGGMRMDRAAMRDEVNAALAGAVERGHPRRHRHAPPGAAPARHQGAAGRSPRARAPDPRQHLGRGRFRRAQYLQPHHGHGPDPARRRGHRHDDHLPLTELFRSTLG